MNVFEAVKTSINTREAAAMYGVEVGCYGGNNDGGAEFVPHVVLDDHHGAIPLLLRADTFAQIRIV